MVDKNSIKGSLNYIAIISTNNLYCLLRKVKFSYQEQLVLALVLCLGGIMGFFSCVLYIMMLEGVFQY